MAPGPQARHHSLVAVIADQSSSSSFVDDDVLREYLDWRPYSYFTNRLTPLGRGPLFFPCIETIEFTPTDAGTMVHWPVG